MKDSIRISSVEDLGASCLSHWKRGILDRVWGRSWTTMCCTRLRKY